ncbi:MAG: hypothetical protein IPK78_01460 [Rhodospirillales bacterium]|nr:hypothetical protein [Rhodospirillales bacterium]
MRASTFKPIAVVTMAVARVYPNGVVEVLDSATGYTQPPAALTVARKTLASASTTIGVYLYGNCGNPNNISTCYYYGTGAVSARLAAIAGSTSFKETKEITDASSNAYSITLSGASRPASATGSATYNGSNWPLGRNAWARITRYEHREVLTCPAACPPGAASARTAPSDMAKMFAGARPDHTAAGVKDLRNPAVEPPLALPSAESVGSDVSPELQDANGVWNNYYVFQPYNGFGSDWYATNYNIGLAERQFRNDPAAWNYYSTLMRNIAPGYWQTRSTLETSLQTGGIAGLDNALNSIMGPIFGGLAGVGIRL